MFARDNITYEPVDLPDRLDYSAEQSLAGASAFHDRMKQRHTVRDYADRPVSKEVIEVCIRTAGTAPSGANHQPWHFVAISDPAMKRRIRDAAEEEERRFYDGGAGSEWLKALEPIGTSDNKPHLEEAPWLIVVFAQRWGQFDDGTRFKNYYVPESTGISCGFLLAALHHHRNLVGQARQPEIRASPSQVSDDATPSSCAVNHGGERSTPRLLVHRLTRQTQNRVPQFSHTPFACLCRSFNRLNQLSLRLRSQLSWTSTN